MNVARLSERYATFVAEVRAGDFSPPPAGSWPAEWIAAHVARNTELLIATTQAVLADDPADREQQQPTAWAAQDRTRFRESMASAERAAADIRYDNSDAMDPATLDRYAISGLPTPAGQVGQCPPVLSGRAAQPGPAEPPTPASSTQATTTIIDA